MTISDIAGSGAMEELLRHLARLIAAAELTQAEANVLKITSRATGQYVTIAILPGDHEKQMQEAVRGIMADIELAGAPRLIS